MNRITTPSIVMLALFSTLLLGCGDSSDDSSGDTTGTTSNGTTTESCMGTIIEVPASSAAHVDEGTTVDYASNPPAIGDHYAAWLGWGVYTEEVKAENYVHNLEHGGIAFLYNCPDGCEDMAQELTSIATTWPADDGGDFRHVVSPFSTSPTPVSVVAWGWVYSADCINTEEITGFINDHYRMAPEDVSVGGIARP